MEVLCTIKVRHEVVRTTTHNTWCDNADELPRSAGLGRHLPQLFLRILRQDFHRRGPSVQSSTTDVRVAKRLRGRFAGGDGVMEGV